MARLDDAVSRILRVKEKRGLFAPDRKLFRDVTAEEAAFIRDFQQKCAQECITLLRDRLGHFPLSPEKTPRIGVSVIAEYAPAKAEALALKEALEKRGFTVSYNDEDKVTLDETKAFYKENDLIIYAAFSRPFRPIGFLDYTMGRAKKVQNMFIPDHATDKVIVVSFGSPYFVDQYFEKAGTYVNAYSMLACSAKAFVRAACGEIEFMGSSPVELLNGKGFVKA